MCVGDMNSTLKHWISEKNTYLKFCKKAGFIRFTKVKEMVTQSFGVIILHIACVLLGDMEPQFSY